jgi:hypothetical protein
VKTSLEVEGLLMDPQSLAAAANEEFAAPTRPAAGWDPYEVWRTRIKEAQQNQERDQAKSDVYQSVGKAFMMTAGVAYRAHPGCTDASTRLIALLRRKLMACFDAY